MLFVSFKACQNGSQGITLRLEVCVRTRRLKLEVFTFKRVGTSQIGSFRDKNKALFIKNAKIYFLLLLSS